MIHFLMASAYRKFILCFLSSIGAFHSQEQHNQPLNNHQAMAEPANVNSGASNGNGKIKAIIFDLDGTLLDTETLSDRAMYATLGLKCPDDYRLPWELKQNILGKRGNEWAPIVLSYASKQWPEIILPDEETLCNQWEENLSRYCEEVRACPGATELVRQFAKLGLPMGVATSSRQAAVQKKRTRHEDLFRHFSTIVCGDHPSVRAGKPAPDIYLEAARQLKVDPSECLVFEDALSGVRSGAAAGCTVVAIPDSRFDASERAVFLVEADVVLESMWQFDGRTHGIDVNMSSLKDDNLK